MVTTLPTLRIVLELHPSVSAEQDAFVVVFFFQQFHVEHGRQFVGHISHAFESVIGKHKAALVLVLSRNKRVY